MNGKKLVGLLISAVLVFSVMAGCAGKPAVSSQSSSSAPASSQAAVSSQPESAVTPESDVSSVASSAVKGVETGQPAPSQNGPVLPVKTDDKEFDAKFAANPIDKAYIGEQAKAVSNVDMVNVSQKFSAVWQKEIDHAFSELEKHMAADSSKKPEQLKAEQTAWLNGKAAALKKISQEEQSAGGSMAQVNEASKTMDFYRGRAAQLYKELYSYTKEFSYAYGAKG